MSVFFPEWGLYITKGEEGIAWVLRRELEIGRLGCVHAWGMLLESNSKKGLKTELSR